MVFCRSAPCIPTGPIGSAKCIALYQGVALAKASFDAKKAGAATGFDGDSAQLPVPASQPMAAPGMSMAKKPTLLMKLACSPGSTFRACYKNNCDIGEPTSHRCTPDLRGKLSVKLACSPGSMFASRYCFCLNAANENVAIQDLTRPDLT